MACARILTGHSRVYRRDSFSKQRRLGTR